jgi:hypothetical protein
MMHMMRVSFAVLLGALTLRAQTTAVGPVTAFKAPDQSKAGLFVPPNGAPLNPAPANPPYAPCDVTGIGSSTSIQADRFVLKGSVPMRSDQDAGLRFDLAKGSCTPLDSQPASAQAAPTRPKAINYSNAYYVRLKIHKYASFATLPLFIAEFAVGQKLYNGTTSDSLRSAHSGLAAGIAVLFGANSVTGVWNLWEARKDPNGRGKRMFHGILMLAADGGFVATGALAPHRANRSLSTSGGAATHRAVALSSMGVAAVSYLYMLFAR